MSLPGGYVAELRTHVRLVADLTIVSPSGRVDEVFVAEPETKVKRILHELGEEFRKRFPESRGEGA